MTDENASTSQTFQIRTIRGFLISSIIIVGIILGVAGENKSQTCTPAPVGLAEWWTADGNALGGRNRSQGSLQNGATFAAGTSGQAFSLDGVNDYVNFPGYSTLNVGAGDGLTLETWINPSNLNNEKAVFEWNFGGGLGVHFWINTSGGGYAQGWMYGALVDTSGGFHIFNSGGAVITANSFQHIALTYNKTSGMARMYRNGVQVAQSNLGTFTPQTSTTHTLSIGARPFRTDSFFVGLIDEPSIYSRELSATEIGAIYNAGTGGKCKPTAIAKPSGLIGFWAGDGNALDSQGVSHGGLSSGAGYTVGKVGQSFMFNGSSNSTHGSAAALNPTSAITIEAWIKPIGGQNTHRDIVGKDGEGFNRQYLITVSENNRIRGHVGTVSGGFQWAEASPIIPLHSWTHVAMTYQPSNIRVYVNGVLGANYSPSFGSWGNIISTSETLRIGGGAPAGQPQLFFPGSIDEVSIYNRALSNTEIQSIYNAGTAGKYKSVFTPMDSGAFVLGDTIITFPEGTSEGITQQIPLDSSLLPPLPTGYADTGLNYDISTSAVFTGSPTLCFNLQAFNDSMQFSRLKVLHLENGIWVNRTTSNNFATRTLCGQTSFLSPFAIADNLAPSAATASISGQTLTAVGQPISRVRVSVTDSAGETRYALTNPFGYFRFDELTVGETYIVSVSSKRYSFANGTQIIQLVEDLDDIRFIANEL